MRSTNSTTKRLVATIALTLLAGGALGACGDSDGGSDAKDKTTTTAAKGQKSATTTTDDDPSATTEPEDETTTTEADEDTTTTEAEDDTPTTVDDEPSGDAQDYVDAMMRDFEEDDGEDLPIEKGQIECLASGYVDTVGVDRLQEAGVSPTEFASGGPGDTTFPEELAVDEDTANELWEQFDDCGIDMTQVLKDVFVEEGEVTSQQQDCIDEFITDDNLRESFVADALGEELENDPMDEVVTCLGFDGSTGSAGATASTIARPTPTTSD